MTWTEEYRPDSLGDVIGNRDERKELHNWAKNWDEDSDPVIVYGPPGVGKTTSCHALANDKDWEVMEMNASEKRSGSIIDKIAGEASRTITLSGNRRKLILLDEADNLHGNADRGGKTAITRVIKNAEQPIILIANDFYDMSRTLRNKCKDIEFNHLDVKEIAEYLKNICENRDIDYEADALKTIARNAEGDVRASINDLQSVAIGNGEVNGSNVSLSSRNQEEEIFPFLDSVLKEDSAENVHEVSREVDKTPDELFRWLSENMDREYSGDELRSGFEFLTNADIWLSRTYKTQNYRYWRYAADNLTAGLASARDGEHGGWTRWQPPRYRSPSGYSDDLLEKIATEQGCSVNAVRTQILPHLSEMISLCKPRELTVDIAAQYDLDESEVSEVTGSGKTTNKVESIVKDAQEKRSQFEIQKSRESHFNVPDEEDEDTTQQIEEGEDDSEDEDTTQQIEEDEDDSEDEDTTQQIEEDEDDSEQSGLNDFL